MFALVVRKEQCFGYCVSIWVNEWCSLLVFLGAMMTDARCTVYTFWQVYVLSSCIEIFRNVELCKYRSWSCFLVLLSSTEESPNWLHRKKTWLTKKVLLESAADQAVNIHCLQEYCGRKVVAVDSCSSCSRKKNNLKFVANTLVLIARLAHHTYHFLDQH